MNKELIELLTAKLKEEKSSLEKELGSFAERDKNVKDNWEAKPVKADDTDLEEKAGEMQEYDNLVSLEHSLELKLKDVNHSLEKIAAGNYGACEKCRREIGQDRLMVCPEARLCMDCNK